ncbi:cyclin-C isoform X1 [Pogoniulus pusillus]|uniref:cyclin-C isoform X1 n=1 Tax=Pogoniulus pusillus TaxID=488313 RepID=UPI0030B93320
MAGNFWQSSHYLQWILDKQDLLKERQKDLKFLTEEEYWKLQIFFTNVIQALGEHLKLRQQVIATATVYFKRFYARYSLKSIDPVLMAPTCVFLASKVEEFGVVSNTRLISAATSVLKTRFSYAFPKEFPYRMNHILECEFYLLELMDCCLIVYHPYRPLLQYVQDMGQEDMLLPLAWRIVNDTYRTDLCLLYPPFMIALACLHVACVVQQKDARQWFAELSVDMEKAQQASQAYHTLTLPHSSTLHTVSRSSLEAECLDYNSTPWMRPATALCCPSTRWHTLPCICSPGLIFSFQQSVDAVPCQEL